jgi:hypothetical protein
MWMDFYNWNCDACEHEDGVLLHHHLGNIGLIAFFRDVLTPHVDRLEMIVKKIIYNGMHAGDWLSLEDVDQLRSELEVLAQINGQDSEEEKFLRDFEQQLRELAECSRQVGKPIVF